MTQKRQAPLAGGARRESGDDRHANPTPTPSELQCDGGLVARTRRLRLVARCLSRSPVFVCDHPLTAELFDGAGRCVEQWCWP